MHLEDDRTNAQKRTHTVLVRGHDTFMSGWGKAAGGKSFAIWACLPEDSDAVLAWVKSREEMKNVRICGPRWRAIPGGRSLCGRGHTHIYVVDREKDHPSLAGVTP